MNNLTINTKDKSIIKKIPVLYLEQIDVTKYDNLRFSDDIIWQNGIPYKLTILNGKSISE